MNGATQATTRRMAAVGMFDGVHLGHQALMSELSSHAAARGLIPIAFTFSSHPLATIAPGACPVLLTTAAQRCQLLMAAGAAEVEVLDFAPLRKLTAGEFMGMLHEQYRVDAMLMGFNNRLGSDGITTADDYRRMAATKGIEMLFAKEYVGAGIACSSSAIRADLAEGAVERAAIRLGRPYAIEGCVTTGQQIGRTIGFPTANISTQQPLALATGVYAADVDIDGITYRAIVNIGRRPTVDNAGAAITIEAHILDFSGDLYGRNIALRFLRYMRAERRFDSVDDLASQLRADASAARRLIL